MESRLKPPDAEGLILRGRQAEKLDFSLPERVYQSLIFLGF
jgi:hypothetical protein